MSDATILTFDAPSKLGKVASVDTSRVLIAVENAALLPRAAVGSLVAIQGTTAQDESWSGCKPHVNGVS